MPDHPDGTNLTLPRTPFVDKLIIAMEPRSTWCASETGSKRRDVGDAKFFHPQGHSQRQSLINPQALETRVATFPNFIG